MITRINPYKLTNTYALSLQQKSSRTNPTFGMSPDNIANNVGQDVPILLSEAIKKVLSTLKLPTFSDLKQAVMPQDNIILTNIFMQATKGDNNSVSVNIVYKNSKPSGGSALGSINIAKGPQKIVMNTMEQADFLQHVIRKLKKVSEDLLYDTTSRLED